MSRRKYPLDEIPWTVLDDLEISEDYGIPLGYVKQLRRRKRLPKAEHMKPFFSVPQYRSFMQLMAFMAFIYPKRTWTSHDVYEWNRNTNLVRKREMPRAWKMNKWINTRKKRDQSTHGHEAVTLYQLSPKTHKIAKQLGLIIGE